MPKAENHRTEQKQIAGVTVNIVSYQIGDQHYCHISNVDPGATIARAEGETREEAIKLATEKAEARLQ